MVSRVAFPFADVMMKKNPSKKCLAVIPARGGSKKLPGKNIKPLNGIPLIAYTIEAALSSGKIARVIVSTDDKEIAEIAVKHGAETPFLRPAELAKDDTPDRPVLMHAINWLKENEGYVANEVAILRPTTPLKTAEMIDACLELLEEKQFLSSVRTVTKAQGVYHP
jgi:CMP-N-acetylneuraminic acid synthetase